MGVAMAETPCGHPLCMTCALQIHARMKATDDEATCPLCRGPLPALARPLGSDVAESNDGSEDAFEILEELRRQRIINQNQNQAQSQRQMEEIMRHWQNQTRFTFLCWIFRGWLVFGILVLIVQLARLF